MCGIAAVLGAAADRIGDDFVRRMVGAQTSRGPNGSGVQTGDSYALGHNRLALIDLAQGAQPMSDVTGSVWLTFNGEIYNFRELRSELEGKGHSFRTNSDSEVIIHAWNLWGENCVEKLRGMFAFVLVDAGRRRALAARDPFGIKPLFVRKMDRGLVFASDLNAISRALPLSLTGRPVAIDLFLRYQYIPEPLTVYEEIDRVCPATAMLIDLDSMRVATRRYHDFSFRRSLVPEALITAAAIRSAKHSIHAHTIADVPYGIFFSGGADSSFVASVLRKGGADPVAYTLGVRDGNEEEVDISRDVASALNLKQEIEWTDADSETDLRQALRAYGEPFADSSALTCWTLSRRAAADVRLVLSGDGGDEVFGGYETYRQALELEREICRQDGGSRGLFRHFRQRLSPDTLGSWDLRSVARHLLNCRLVTSDADRAALFRQEFRHLAESDDPLLDTIKPAWFGEGVVDFAQRLDFERYLVGSVLRKVDVSSMCFGLEVRVPFLDVDVLKSACRLPRRVRVPEYANGREVGKLVIRRELSKSIGDSMSFAWKRGFGTPKRKIESLQRRLAQSSIDEGVGLFRLLDRQAVTRLHSMALESGRDGLAWTLGCLLFWAAENPDIQFG